MAVALLTIGVLVILSAFGSAGVAGAYIDDIMALLFGWMRLVVRGGFASRGALLLMPHSERITPWTYIGLILFFLSANGFINLMAFNKTELSERALSSAGGYVGLLFQQLGIMTVGFWGSVVILIALIVASILLILHTSLSDIATLLRWRHGESDDIDEDDEAEEDHEEEEERPRRTPSIAGIVNRKRGGKTRRKRKGTTRSLYGA